MTKQTRGWWSRFWYSDIGHFLWESMKDVEKWKCEDLNFDTVTNEDLDICLRRYEHDGSKMVSVYLHQMPMNTDFTSWDHYRLNRRVFQISTGYEKQILELKKHLKLIN